MDAIPNFAYVDVWAMMRNKASEVLKAMTKFEGIVE
jgi:hypothetical protein